MAGWCGTESMRISEVSRLTGASAKAIRLYERAYEVWPHPRILYNIAINLLYPGMIRSEGMIIRGSGHTKLPPIPLSILEQAHDIARRVGLHYVYIGNVPGHDYANTYCPKCGKILVNRKGLLIQQNNIVAGV